jgi:hypothetical protein
LKDEIDKKYQFKKFIKIKKKIAIKRMIIKSQKKKNEGE